MSAAVKFMLNIVHHKIHAFIKYFTYLFLEHLQNSMVQFLYLFEMKFSLLKNILVRVNWLFSWCPFFASFMINYFNLQEKEVFM